MQRSRACSVNATLKYGPAHEGLVPLNECSGICADSSESSLFAYIQSLDVDKGSGQTSSGAGSSWAFIRGFCAFAISSPISFFQTWEADMLMDADNVILLAQCLRNRYMPVCSFTFGF